jgi:hypothetical protein
MIAGFRDKYWQRIPRRQGRPRKTPPHPRAFAPIPDLVGRLRSVRSFLRYWSEPEALSDRDALRRVVAPGKNSELREQNARAALTEVGIPEPTASDEQDFILDRLLEEPTEAAVRIAHQVARAKVWFEGDYRSFYDAFRESGNG